MFKSEYEAPIASGLLLLYNREAVQHEISSPKENEITALKRNEFIILRLPSMQREAYQLLSIRSQII